MHNWQLLLLKILKIFGPLAYGIFACKTNTDRKLWVPITLNPVATSIKFKSQIS